MIWRLIRLSPHLAVQAEQDKMIIIACVTGGFALNAVVGTLYRQGKLSTRVFRWLAVLTNILAIYFSQIAMGILPTSPLALIVALIGGISIGVQGANVIIRIGRLEARQKQKASTEE